MQKKTIRLAKETLRRLDLARGGAAAYRTWSDCPMISSLSCTYDNDCCVPAAEATRLG
jgi:hypothetical protein